MSNATFSDADDNENNFKVIKKALFVKSEAQPHIKNKNGHPCRSVSWFLLDKQFVNVLHHLLIHFHFFPK